MKDNPFKTDTYTSTWLEHYTTNNQHTSTGPFKDLNFIKHSVLPLYTNVGGKSTKGISYDPIISRPDVLKNKVFLIYDWPTYFPVTEFTNNPGVGLYRTKQYPGFLIDLTPFKTLQDYMSKSFSKSSRYKLNKYKKRLEASFNIKYVMYRDEISQSEFLDLFDKFKLLLEKRFDDKAISNNNLDPEEWNFYKDVSYKLMCENKAGLFVIYNNDTPIGITLNYFSDDILFDAITVFDIDYTKFHLGSVTIMGIIEWCLENEVRVLDFSKGYFDYKTRWANKEYDFEYHIYYDKKSLISRTLAYMLKKTLELKQKLRDKGYNEKFHQLTYRLNRRRVKTNSNSIDYSFQDAAEDVDITRLQALDLDDTENHWLRPLVYEFLYLYPGHLNNCSLYSFKNQSNTYLVSTEDKTQVIKVNTR